MFEEFKDFQIKVTASAAAPYNETPEYAEFMSVFLPTTLAISILISYLFSILIQYNIWFLDGKILELLPVLTERMKFLEYYGEASKASLTGTVLAGLFSLFFALTFNMIGYWKSVIALGGCKKLNYLSAVSLLSGWVVVLVISWIVFIDVPHTGGSGRIGTAIIFRWPVFPFIGAVTFWLLEFCVFSIIVSIFKIVSNLRGK